jgi:hypothetical protein
MAKSFILSEESINDRGFRVLTGGINLERFKKNPVMLWMHRRDDGWDLTQVLPIGIWENIRKEDGKLLADPKFDENDKFSMMIKSKVENDLIRGCSAGINPVEFSTDTKDLEKGQTRATITKCEIYEASIVDMPSNKNTVRLFSSADETKEIPLIKNNTDMADSKKDEKQLTFKSEAEALTFMKEKFGLEPKVKTPEAKPEEEFKFKSEDDARNWFQKLFGLEPKAKEPEEKKEDLKTEKVEETAASKKEKEIETLKAQIETLKSGPGAENLKTTEKTDDAPAGSMEELLSDEDIKLFNSVKQ